MENAPSKALLKNGDIVVTRDGDRYIKVDDVLINDTKKRAGGGELNWINVDHLPLEDYNEDLTINRLYSDILHTDGKPKFDIVAIYNYLKPYQLIWSEKGGEAE